MAKIGGFPRRPLLGRTRTISESPEDPIGDDAIGGSEDDDEEVEIKISASGSVLTPSLDPYDKFQKLKHANAVLMACRLPPRPPGKVRFNDTVMTAEETEEGSEHVQGIEPLKPCPGKTLLVTVPTGLSEDVEEAISDEEVADETDFNIGDSVKIKEDCSNDTAAKLKISLAHADYSVDMKSLDEDYESTVDDLTTTLVSLCRMTSECEDTNLESNISKYEKIEVDPELEVIGENEEEVAEDPNSDEVQELDGKSEEESEDDKEDEAVERVTAENIVQRIASARIAMKEPKKENEKLVSNERPSTSPGKRVCFKNQWAYAKLPSYNGLRSEYGLSAEQLQERKQKRVETVKLQRQRKEEIFREEKRRQKENEQMFATWLVKKKKEAAMKAARRQQLQSAFHFKTLPAPTSHLEKMGILRKKVLARREHTCYSLEEFFKNAKPHEQKTYKIYLGLCVE